MDEDRKLRYQEKIHWIKNRMVLIETWTIEFSQKKMKPDTKTTLAIFKAYQEIVEATMDIMAMCIRDQGIAARDDYSNIDAITLFSDKQKELLRAMNGLRNRIIHRYNATDEKLAINGINDSLPEVSSLLVVFEEWILKN